MNKYKRNTRGDLFCLSLIFYSLFILTVTAQCEEWITLGENHVGKFLYDKNSISITENGVVAMDMKVIMSTAGSEDLAVKTHLKGVSVTLYHDEINCRTRVYECKRIRYYDRKGKLLVDTDTDETADSPTGIRTIPYDTPIERLADIVCE
jgi:hypothetical protein